MKSYCTKSKSSLAPTSSFLQFSPPSRDSPSLLFPFVSNLSEKSFPSWSRIQAFPCRSRIKLGLSNLLKNLAIFFTSRLRRKVNYKLRIVFMGLNPIDSISFVLQL